MIGASRKGQCVQVMCSAALLLVLSMATAAVADMPPLVVDGHNHDALSARDGLVDLSGLSGLRARGIDVAVVPLPLDRSVTPDIESRIAAEMEELRRIGSSGARISIARPDELLGGSQKGEVGLLFSIEWFGSIFGEDPARVERFRDLGVRLIGLAEDDPDGVFGVGDRSADLTPFGERIVSAMNGAGVLIDITHLSHARKLEIIRHSRRPVVASHSIVFDVCPTSFNLPPEVVEGLAATGGSVWVSFNSSDLLSCDPDGDPLELLVDHIESLVTSLGPEHVGIGTDLQAGGSYVPAALNRDDTFAEIGRRLSERGYSKDVVAGVMGRNVLRVLTAVTLPTWCPTSADR